MMRFRNILSYLAVFLIIIVPVWGQTTDAFEEKHLITIYRPSGEVSLERACEIPTGDVIDRCTASAKDVTEEGQYTAIYQVFSVEQVGEIGSEETVEQKFYEEGPFNAQLVEWDKTKWQCEALGDSTVDPRDYPATTHFIPECTSGNCCCGDDIYYNNFTSEDDIYGDCANVVQERFICGNFWDVFKTEQQYVESYDPGAALPAETYEDWMYGVGSDLVDETYDVEQQSVWLWADSAMPSAGKNQILYLPCGEIEVLSADNQWYACGEGANNSFDGGEFSNKAGTNVKSKFAGAEHEYLCLNENSKGSIIECCGPRNFNDCYSRVSVLDYVKRNSLKYEGESVYQGIRNPGFDLGLVRTEDAAIELPDDTVAWVPEYWDLYNKPSPGSDIAIVEREGENVLKLDYSGGKQGGQSNVGIISDVFRATQGKLTFYYNIPSELKNARFTVQIFWYSDDGKEILLKDADDVIFSTTENTGNWQRVVKTFSVKRNYARVLFKIAGSSSSQATVFVDDIGYGEPLYCTAKYDNDQYKGETTWVSDLDGTNKNACEKAGDAIGIQFAWTGTRCCGDDGKEYYTEEGSGCYSGSPVAEGSKVSDEVVFSDGKFLGCNIHPNNQLMQIKDINGDNVIMNSGYCTVADSGPNKQFFCNTDGKWSSDAVYDDSVKDDTFDTGKRTGTAANRSFIKDNVPYSIEGFSEGCCPQDYCWDGDQCVEDQSDEPLQKPIKGYRCINGSWELPILKKDWTGLNIGYCPTSETCYVKSNFGEQSNLDIEFPNCVESGAFVSDHYCEDGNWTTRTKYLATQLLNYSQQESPNDYVLFCDSYTKTLNDNKYSPTNPYFVGINQIEEFLTDDKVSNFCVLKSGDKVVLGSVLNQGVDAPELSLLATLLHSLGILGGNINAQVPTYCQSAMQKMDGQFHACKTDRIWYNAKQGTIIYSKDGILLGELSFAESFTSFLLNPIQKTLDVILGVLKPRTLTGPADIEFIKETKDYNKIYVAKTNSKLVEGINEVSEGKEYFSVTFKGFDSDVCLSVKQFDINLDIFGFNCQPVIENGQLYYNVVSVSQDAIPSWVELTAKLRVVE